MSREIIEKYLQAQREETYWKKIREDLREDVVSHLKKEYYDDIYLSSRTSKVDWDHGNLYKWLEEQVALGKLKRKELYWVLQRKIDDDRLAELFEKGRINELEIPKDCYDLGKESNMINIPENRKRNK